MNMVAALASNSVAFSAVSKAHNGKWHQLCARYLPVMSEDDSIWRYSRATGDDDLNQGWKLHVSATILTAHRVFETVAPYLKSRRALFKAPRSLQELQKINSGLSYGYSQVGKFITVYPRSSDEAVLLARKLHRLTRHLSAPAVPFDLRFRANSCVYYRYGSFEPLALENPDGTFTPAMRDREGILIPDSRYSEKAAPDWVADPFLDRRQRKQNCSSSLETPLKTTFRAFQSLAQRGKGGVYKAIDLSAHPPRLCILKEGRRDGETAWDSRDGYWMAKHEQQVLESLRIAGIEVPAVYSSFEAGRNYYLVTEFIRGETLLAFLLRRRRRLPVSCALRYAVQLSALLSRIHQAGWAWRDCKPTNLMVTEDLKLRPVDFEGACPVNRLDPMLWSTPEFMPPERRHGESQSSAEYDDLYALGAVIYLLLMGRLPDASTYVPLGKLRRNAPAEVQHVVEELLGANPKGRPAARIVRQRLAAASSIVDRWPKI